MNSEVLDRRGTMIGREIEKKELQARWAYTELTSVRFKSNYEPSANSDLFYKAENGVDFSSLTADERDRLVKLHEKYRRGFLPLMEFARFSCESWSKLQLASIWALPAFDPNGKQHPIPFLTFLALPRLNNLDGTPDNGDPRREADKVPTDQGFGQTEPLVVGLLGTVPILIDGYCRAVLFMRSENPAAQLLVWIPR